MVILRFGRDYDPTCMQMDEVSSVEVQVYDGIYRPNDPRTMVKLLYCAFLT